jgi:CHASE3 domain sensor protein
MSNELKELQEKVQELTEETRKLRAENEMLVQFGEDLNKTLKNVVKETESLLILSRKRKVSMR